MSGKLKLYINDPNFQEEWKEYINEQIDCAHNSLDIATEPVVIYRLQGEILRLKKFLKLREEINDSSNKARQRN